MFTCLDNKCKKKYLTETWISVVDSEGCSPLACTQIDRATKIRMPGS